MIVKIRPGNYGDARSISALNQLVQDKHSDAVPWLFKPRFLDDEAIKTILDRKDTTLLVACVDDKVVGYAYGQIKEIPETSLTNSYTAMHVHHISVFPEFQDLGIGRSLMRGIREIANKHQMDRLTVNYWIFNDQAKRFFRSFGMQPYLELAWEELTN